MSFLLPHKVDVIPHPFLVVCEGFGDASFICALLERLEISNCSVGCPSRAGGHGEGKDAVLKYLQAVKVSIDLGKAKLLGVLVVVDADADADLRFNAVASALTASGFKAPSGSFRIEGNQMRTGIFLIPGQGKTGTLEDLFWDAVIDKNPDIESCVLDFCKCAGNHIDQGSPNEQAKMKVSALVSSHCTKNPWVSLGLIWTQDDNPIPIASKRFKEIAEFLISFTSSGSDSAAI